MLGHRYAERQPCLADAARPEERQEAHRIVLQAPSDLLQLGLSPDQGRGLDREIACTILNRRERGEAGRQTRMDELEDAVRAFQALELMLA